ncbi:AAA family ATPase [Vibrio parahaemolyticus]|uniref:AAA family ATPase n=1 Tax=Vibrio parahaemolyticus TaxID=670 RepID=UPI00226B36B9|nr:AAA family ATPase [Vibrio parahaemolyticus]MCX8941246.1 AAA family ATPase [Vibrio parahaemolyticus]
MIDEYDIEADIAALLEMHEQEQMTTSLSMSGGIEAELAQRSQEDNVHPINSQFKVHEIKPPKPRVNDFDKVPKVSSLLSKTIPPKEFLFEGDILPKNEVTVTPAAGGSGKTLFAAQQAIQCALGRTFMISPKGKKVFAPKRELSVLFLSYEDSREDILRRVQGIIRAYPNFDYSERSAIQRLDDNLKVVYMPSDTEGLLASLSGSSGMVKAHAYNDLSKHLESSHYDLVIIDPFHYSAELDENGNAAMGAYMQLLRDLCVERDTTIWAFAHTSRGNQLETRGAAAVQQRSRQGIMFADYVSLIENKYLDNRVRRSLPPLEAIPEGVDVENVVCIKAGKNNHGVKHKEWFMLEIKSVYPDPNDKSNSYPAMVPFDVLSRDQVESNERHRPLTPLEKQIENLLFDSGYEGLNVRTISQYVGRSGKAINDALDTLVERSLIEKFDGSERNQRKGTRFAVVGNSKADIAVMVENATEIAKRGEPLPWETNEY